jgi:hydrogenase nickel incorporation protein HypB
MEIPVIKDVLEESNQRALENRALLDENGVFTVNIMSSPGSGKTSLLQKIIPLLQAQKYRCAVIEGDIATTLDSERLTPLNIPVIQANTEPFGGDCHLGSHFVKSALKHLDLSQLDFLFIENIGNLVCPAEFYLGEDVKVVALSITEGEDKPLKYPLMFRECQMCLLTKMDLAPYLEIDLNLLKNNLRRVNSQLEVIEISARSGIGLDDLVRWLMKKI